MPKHEITLDTPAPVGRSYLATGCYGWGRGSTPIKAASVAATGCCCIPESREVTFMIFEVPPGTTVDQHGYMRWHTSDDKRNLRTRHVANLKTKITRSQRLYKRPAPTIQPVEAKSA